MVTDLPWSKVSSLTQDLNFYSLQEPRDIEPKELEKEKENQLEDALSVLILRTYQSLLLKKVNNKFPALPILLSQEDLVQKEPTISENSMVLKDNKEKTNQSPLLLLKRTSPEEPSKAKRIQMPHKDKKLQRFKDLSPISDLEERESLNKIKLEDGKNQLKLELLTINWLTNTLPKEKLLKLKLELKEKTQRLPKLNQLKLNHNQLQLLLAKTKNDFMWIQLI